MKLGEAYKNTEDKTIWKEKKWIKQMLKQEKKVSGSSTPQFSIQPGEEAGGVNEESQEDERSNKATKRRSKQRERRKVVSVRLNEAPGHLEL